MKHIKLLFYLLMFFAFTATAFAQQGTITGIVSDNETGRLLKGVNITGSSGKSLVMTDENGRFQITFDAGTYILYFNQEGYDQFTLNALIKQNETTDAGKILMVNQNAFQRDLPTISISDGGGEDGMESQSIQGLLNSSSDVFVSAAAYTFGPLMFRMRGYEQNYSLVTLNGFVMNDVESGAPYFSNWGGLNDIMRNTMITSGPDPIGFLFEPVGGIARIITRASVRVDPNGI